LLPGLKDAILDGDGDPNNVGHRIILPSTFTGGPCYMHERQQDAMNYVRKHGHPDLFITTKTNPNWPEIRNSLLPGQDPQDRPDIVACVCRLKVQKLLEMLNPKWSLVNHRLGSIPLNDKSMVYHIVICCCGYQQSIG